MLVHTLILTSDCHCANIQIVSCWAFQRENSVDSMSYSLLFHTLLTIYVWKTQESVSSVWVPRISMLISLLQNFLSDVLERSQKD